VELFDPKFLEFYFRSIQVNYNFIAQWKPLYVITLGQRGTNNINQMITISKPHEKYFDSYLGLGSLG
jgi:hypothetical protein